MRARLESGFSLVELIIAVTLTGVVGAAVVSIIRAQADFYGRLQDGVIAQQNIRAIHDLMGSEIRPASGSDLLAASPDSIVFRFDVSRAVVCDSTGPNEAVVFVYDTVSAVNVMPAFRGLGISGPADSTWLYADGLVPSVLETGGVPRAVCVNAGAPASAPDDRYRKVAGFPTALPHGAPPRGTLLRVYGRLTYSFSARAGGAALRRNAQELATLFRTANFGYRLIDTSVVATPPPSRFSEVAQVLVSGTTLGTSTTNPTTRDFRLTLPMRNTPRNP